MVTGIVVIAHRSPHVAAPKTQPAPRRAGPESLS